MPVFPTTSKNVRELLKKRFCAPEWALFFEVGEGTGSMSGRRADAVAMNLWPSRGLSIHCFEIKVSRADWLSELRNPAKADAIASKCDFWWLVAAKGVVMPGELPEAWGLYEVDGRGLVARKQAPKLSSPPLSREFVAALVRRAGEVDDMERRRIVEAETQRLRADHEERVKREVDRRTRSYTELRQAVDDFERESGLTISGYTGGVQIGKAAAVVRRLGVDAIYSAARAVIQQARVLADGLEKELAGVIPTEDEDERI